MPILFPASFFCLHSSASFFCEHLFASFVRMTFQHVIPHMHNRLVYEYDHRIMSAIRTSSSNLARASLHAVFISNNVFQIFRNFPPFLQRIRYRCRISHGPGRLITTHSRFSHMYVQFLKLSISHSALSEL